MGQGGNWEKGKKGYKRGAWGRKREKSGEHRMIVEWEKEKWKMLVDYRFISLTMIFKNFKQVI